MSQTLAPMVRALMSNTPVKIRSIISLENMPAVHSKANDIDQGV
jgi:hypothetical protein